MENLKIKVIGVLREREEIGNSNSNNKKVHAAVGVVVGGGGGGAAAAGTAGACSANSGVVRQLQKMSALDLAGILNCRRRLEWTKEWLKKNQTEFLSKENLLKEIQFRSNEIYHLNCFFDITERQFRYLVTKLAPVISSYEPHRKKKSFSAEERIAITLKYLATGEVHSCRNYCFRASKPVILKMISDICLNIYELLKDQFLSLPKTDEQWQNVVNEQQRKTQLPNCLGNLTMQQLKFYTSARQEEQPDFVAKPPFIFTAIIDSNNNFMFVDIEKTSARAADEIYECSSIRQLIENKTLPLPAHDDDNISNSYYFAGNGALPVKPYLLNSRYYVPTSRDLSYTFSRFGLPEYDYCYCMDVANMHVENALRILSNIFPILAQPLRIEDENARKITLGAVALYNFLRKTDRTFCEQTEKIIADDEEEVIIDEEGEEDDCILIASEEEQRERQEFTPNVAMTSCFQLLRKQKGDTSAGLVKRERLMQHISDTKLTN